MKLASPDIARPAAIALLLAVASCGSDQKFPPDCRPNLALAPDAADLTLYRPGGRDVTDLGLQARITAVPAACLMKDRATVSAKVRVDFAVSRGPAAVGRDAVLPYLVAVLDGDRIIDEQSFVQPVAFPPNTDTIAVKGEEITMLLPVSPEKTAAAYTIFASFRLTPEQLAANRSGKAR